MKPLFYLPVLCLSLSMADAAVLQNRTVRVEADGRAVKMSVRDAGRWRTVLVSGAEAGGKAIGATPVTVASADKAALRLRRSIPGGQVQTVLTLAPGRVHVASTLRLAAPRDVEGLLASWRFAPDGKPGKPDTTWTPNLRPNRDEVIGMHVFRSPGVVVQQGRLAATVLPDLDVLAKNWQTMPATLNLDVTPPSGPLLTVALQPHDVVRHVYWRHVPGAVRRLPAGTVTLAYDVLLASDAPPRRAYREVARWWWDKQGHNNLKDTLPQAVPWRGYVDAGYGDYLPIIWREGRIDGEAVGGASMDSWGYRNATWFECWFNDLRSAYGTYLWGKWTGRPDLLEKARMTRQLLLASPQKDGLFPIIYDWDRKAWDGSAAGGGPDIYHTADCAWAAYWLLMWDQDLERHPASIAFSRRLGDGLIKLQRPSGEIPSFIRMADMQPTERLQRGAETSASGMFLAFLGRVTGDARYIRAARQAAAYLRREVMPRNRWYDYETFYSCSGKPETFTDPYTGQLPQNNLSIQWTTELFRQLYLAERNPADLSDGEAVLDYLNLYQQVWAAPYLSFEGFGGYGVQNTDAEWNDARQAQFACTNLDYYRLTGKPEYLERGIAAARAGFATTYMPENAFISPRTFMKVPTGHADENYGHGGVDAPAGPTSWDWGTGSALTTAAVIRRSFGDVWVDFDRGQAFGINGVTASLTGGRLTVLGSTQSIAPVVVRGRGKAASALIVNGVRRRISAADWRDGWSVNAKPSYRVRHRAPSELTADAATVSFEVWPKDIAVRPVVSYSVASVNGANRTGRLPAEPAGPGRFSATFPKALFPSGMRTLDYSIETPTTGKSPSWRTRVIRFGAETPMWRETFAERALPEPWSLEIPTSGPESSLAGGLTLSVPADRGFDQWVEANDAPKVMRPAPEGDWSCQVRLDTSRLPSGRNNQAGIALQFEGNDILMFGPFRGEEIVVERFGQNRLEQWSVPAGALKAGTVDLRVRNVGRTLWFDWRFQEGAWSAPASLPVGRAPRRLGLFLKTWEPVAASATFVEASAARM